MFYSIPDLSMFYSTPDVPMFYSIPDLLFFYSIPDRFMFYSIPDLSDVVHAHIPAHTPDSSFVQFVSSVRTTQPKI